MSAVFDAFARPFSLAPAAGASRQAASLAPALLPGAGLVLRDVRKSFAGKTVIPGFSLDIPAGQFVVIVGKSGCGKSTLLRLVAGLDKPDGGTIALARRTGADTPPQTRIVFQEPRLLPWARVAANVAVGLGPGVDPISSASRVATALHEVGLADRAKEWPAVLSGGQKQRVALARALVSTPDLLLLDEPLGALDALTRITMQALVARVWKTLGFTALFVTHDVTEAVALADRVIVMDEGRIALDLPIALDRPRTRGTPEFARLEGLLLNAIFGAPEMGL